jgi:hypothetical protein
VAVQVAGAARQGERALDDAHVRLVLQPVVLRLLAGR